MLRLNLSKEINELNGSFDTLPTPQQMSQLWLNEV